MHADDILDLDALLALGHDEAGVHWLLRYAVRGTADRPYLTADEYERLLPDLDSQRRNSE